tara:strand:+ start:4148 stop:6520 length:2373 start_codon:yes stop_codon:yes gene_type:complete
MSRRGKHNNRGSKRHTKGPQISDGERLWKRLASHFSHEPEKWGLEWSAESIANYLILREKLDVEFTKDARSERAFRSGIEQTLADARNKNEHFVETENRCVRIRTPSETEQIKSSVLDWNAFSAVHAPKGRTSLHGSPALIPENAHLIPSMTQDDIERYELLEEVWMAHLSGEDYPPSFSLLPDETVRSWGKFDLVREARFIANRRSGLRFRDAEPSMALLLIQTGRLNARNLLDLRLENKRKGGWNPFPRAYDESLVEAANRLPEIDGDKELANRRKDLRNLPFVTIDPHDAKDFDDAVCLVEEHGVRTLWVAIADVAHYVQPDSRLDGAARARATSVYLPHAVLPMLPPRLADDLCSLRADVDRLAMVVAMEIDQHNEIKTCRAYEAVIRVAENLSYEDALDNPRFAEMFSLAESWQAKEVRLNIQNAELRPRLHGDETIEVEVKWPNAATRMIESFMVATNASVGHLLGQEGAPLPWRCHTPPDAIEVEELNAKLQALGVDIELPMPSLRVHGQSEESELTDLLAGWAGGSIDLSGIQDSENNAHNDTPEYLSNVLDPKARQNILDALERAQQQASELKGPIRRVVDQGLFHLMQRANYSEENRGHFGLNLDAYVHFTSPIRRYPDLMAHRQLKSFLRDEEWVHSVEETAKISKHCSEQGHTAKRIEWELVANAYHLHLLRGGKIGGESSTESTPLEHTAWNARITGLRTPWVFLDLADDGAIHGRMHLRQIGGKTQMSIDEYGLAVIPAEPDQRGDQHPVVQLGQIFPCRLRGLDIWSGTLDLAPN